MILNAGAATDNMQETLTKKLTYYRLMHDAQARQQHETVPSFSSIRKLHGFFYLGIATKISDCETIEISQRLYLSNSVAKRFCCAAQFIG
jgi:hypothetical protein